MTPPTQRELRNPYFLLRTPDGLGSYLSRNNYRLIKNPNEPLAPFLANARLNEEARPQVIEYDLSGIDTSTLEPLDSLPGSLLEEFTAAARRFADQVNGREGKVAEHTRRLWAGFRLPDPDLEKDAYWVYGPAEDRKLLILWGCEFQQGASLPVTADQAEHPGGAVLDKLSQRKPSWEALQLEAVRLIRQRNLPMERFLGELERDEDGEPAQIVAGGNVVKVKDAKPLGRLPGAEVTAFREQAKALYRKAKADDASTYVRDLITAFQLPDPDAHPNLYFQYKGRLLIALDGPGDRDTSLHPAPEPQLGIPPKNETAGGSSVTPPTVADRLEKRTEGSKLPVLIAGAAAVLALVGAALWYFLLFDATPPALESVVARDNPEEVTVVFSEPVSESDIDIESEDAPTFRIQSEDGPFLRILGASVSDSAPERVVLTVEPMVEAEYLLFVRGLGDTAGNTPPETLETEFEYRDTVAPAVATVSAHETDAKKLRVRFTKDLDPRSVRPSSFDLPGFKAEDATLDEDQRTVTVAFDKSLENGREYQLTIEGIADNTEEGNEIADETREIFTYLDTLPPRFERATAKKSQIIVNAFFNEPLEQASAVNADNYSLVTLDPDGNPTGEVPLDSIILMADNKTVELYTAEPMEAGLTYRITAQGVRDRANPPNKAPERTHEFAFSGSLDRTAPRIDNIEVAEADARPYLTVTFNEPLAPESAVEPGNYRLLGAQARVVGAEPTGEPQTIVLRLEGNLPRAVEITLSATGIADRLGNSVDPNRPSTATFKVSGIGAPPAEDLRTTGPVQVLDEGKTLRVPFEIALVASEASNPANFTVSGGARVIAARPAPDVPARNDEYGADAVLLTLDQPLARGGSYSLEIRNQRLAIAPDTRQWTITENFGY